jgi:hypothetical protein
MTLSPSPVFGRDLTQAELFFVAASAIQQLRCSNRLFEHPQPPLARVLDPDGYLTGRYFEPVIKAAICRACRRSDLRTSTIEPALIAAVSKLMAEPISGELRGELILNVALSKLPQPPNLSELMKTTAPSEAAIWAALSGA